MTFHGRMARAYLAEIYLALRSDLPIYSAIAVYLVIGSGYVVFRGGILMGSMGDYFWACSLVFGLLVPYGLVIAWFARITRRFDRRRFWAYRVAVSPRNVGRFVAGTMLM